MRSYLSFRRAVFLAVATIMISWAPAKKAEAATCAGLDVQAHRGAPGYPENSLEGIAAALSDDLYSGVEIDVQFLSDGTAVLHHDPLPGRVVDNVRLRPLSMLSSSDWQSARFRDNPDLRPPLLSEALDAFSAHRSPHQRLNIEIKSDSTAGGTECLWTKAVHGLVARKLPAGSWDYSTPHMEIMKCLTSADPGVYVGLVVAPSDSELEQKHGDLVNSARDMLSNKFGQGFAAAAEGLAREGYRGFSGQGSLLSVSQRGEVIRHLSGRGGIHMGVGMIEENLDLVRSLAHQGLSVYSYSVNGDARHAAAIGRLSSQGVEVSGAIIDGSPSSFCGYL